MEGRAGRSGLVGAGRRRAAYRREQWRAAMRWRRAVEAALGGVGLTFTQWLLLDATRELIAETGDAVNQNEIARRVELDRSTVCPVMRALEQMQLVDRGGDLTGRAWRIFLTARGRSLCELAAQVVEGVDTGD